MVETWGRGRPPGEGGTYVSVWFGIKGLHRNRDVVKPGEPAGQSAGPRRGSSERPESPVRPRRLGSKHHPLVALIALAAVGALAAACASNNAGSGGSSPGATSSGGSSSGGSSSGGGAYGGGPASTSPTGSATVTATSTKLGSILVDGKGRTLYLFQKDSPNQSACSGACVSAWPVDQSSGTPKAGSGVKASLLSTIKRTDGSTQVTYNKHPLYFYSGDSQAGQQNGQGLNAFGALWYVVAPAGGPMTRGARF